ncbi:hypothetical protein [Bartonella sp. HY038]|uniref:hypothetical protein n=1 Tax=Bartonella sp. HY038 TaxID=2759660 RepID=UPI0015F8D505|nr:hypothetical protein [Bartonella sp. HY038]
MSKEGITDNKNKGNKGKLIVTLIILVLLIGGGIYYYLGLQQKKINAVFEQLKEQGVVFKEWKKNSDKTYSLVEPKLQVSATTQLNVESFDVALKDDGLLDLTLKNVSYKGEIVEVALPTISITGYKLSKDVFDARLKDRMTPFALHLLSNDFKSMVVDNSAVKIAFSMDEVGIGAEFHFKKYQLLDYYKGIVGTQIIDQYEMTADIFIDNEAVSQIKQTSSLEHIEAQDNNLRLQMLMWFINNDKPDQPYEKVSGSITYKNYNTEQATAGYIIQGQTIEEVTIDGISLRYGQKAPVDVVDDWIELTRAFYNASEKGEKYDVSYPKLFGLIRDSLYLIEMVGPTKQVGKNLSNHQHSPGLWLEMNVDEMSLDYKPFNVALQYKGIMVNGKSSAEDSDELLKAKIGLIGFVGVDFSSLYGFAITELDKLSKLERVPDDSKQYWLGVWTNAGKIYPRIERFEIKDFDIKVPTVEAVVKFDEISLNHKYAVSGPIPTSIDFKIANYQQFVKNFIYLPESLGLSDGFLKLSTHIKADWDEEKKQILLHDSFLETNVFGRVDASATIGQVQPYLFSGNMIEMAAAASGLTVKDFKISIDDKGKLSAFKERVAKEEGSSVEEVGYGLISSLVPTMQNYIEDGENRASVVAPIAKFINNGGVIAFDAKSKTNFGVGIPGLAMMDLSNNLDPLWSLFDIAVTVK